MNAIVLILSIIELGPLHLGALSGIVSKEKSVAADTGSRSLCGSIERPKPRMSKAKLKMKILALERTLQETREEKERCKELLEQREAGGSSPGATDVAEQLEEKARLEEQVGALERDLVSLKESAIAVVVLSISFVIAHSKGEEHQERQEALRGKLLPTLGIYHLAVKSLTLLKRIIRGEAWQ